MKETFFLLLFLHSIFSFAFFEVYVIVGDNFQRINDTIWMENRMEDDDSNQAGTNFTDGFFQIFNNVSCSNFIFEGDSPLFSMYRQSSEEFLSPNNQKNFSLSCSMNIDQETTLLKSDSKIVFFLRSDFVGDKHYIENEEISCELALDPSKLLIGYSLSISARQHFLTNKISELTLIGGCEVEGIYLEFAERFPEIKNLQKTFTQKYSITNTSHAPKISLFLFIVLIVSNILSH